MSNTEKMKLRITILTTVFFLAISAGSLFAKKSPNHVEKKAATPKINGIAQKSENKKTIPAEIINLAKTDHATLLKTALKNHKKNISDYTGTFYKQERLGKKLTPEQVISFKFKQKPYSVFMKWEKNPVTTDRVLYVKGANKGKMILHPTGLFSWIKSVKKHPRCKEAVKGNLNTIDKFGFEKLLERLINVYSTTKKNGDAKTSFLGISTLDKRFCMDLELIVPQKKEYIYKRLVIKVDAEYMLPVQINCYDFKDKLIFKYIYKNLKFNVGLKNKHFTPKINRL